MHKAHGVPNVMPSSEGDRPMTRGVVRSTRRRRGSALLLALLFVAMFACMAVALAVASDTNLAISRNRFEINQAHNLVESGLGLVQKEMGDLQVTGSDTAALHACLAEHFREAWANAQMLDAAQITSDAGGVAFPDITVPGPDGRTGTITLSIQADGGVDANPTITVASRGQFGEAVRTAWYDFRIRTGYRLFSDYGVASKSPVTMDGHARIDGANSDREGSLFSCSGSDNRAIDMGGSTAITGDAAVSADGVEIYKGPHASIGGDQITDAPEHPWPTIDTSQFEQYVENVYTSGGDDHNDKTYINVRIPPNTNPTFNGNTNLYGVVYIESPNEVTFNGNANICGIVVCEPPAIPNLDDNTVKFNGNLTACGVEYLPHDSRYDGIRSKTGTFLLAPGFSAKFAGNFSTINGCIAASEFDFAGTASGTVRGTILNLEDTSFSLKGNAHLTIDKANAPQHPAGFDQRYALICVSGSYRE
jgi:hypothetical protein